MSTTQWVTVLVILLLVLLAYRHRRARRREFNDAYIEYLHDELDMLDPGVRALSDEEEGLRQWHLNELRRYQDGQ